MVRPTHAAPSPARSNRLALVSVSLSLVTPLGLLCASLGAGLIAQTFISYTTLWSLAGAALMLVGLPATALAIVAGHTALRRANLLPFPRPLRGVARLGLALGYASLVMYLGLAGLVAWVLVHGIHMHLVY